MNSTARNFLVTPQIYASKEKRFINMIIDMIGYYVFTFMVGFFFGLLALIGIEGPLNYLVEIDRIGELLLGIVIVFTYFTVFEVLTQRSLGKLITKTKVVLEDGTKPTTKDIALRTLCRFIPFEAFSFLGDQGRGWHDSISETYVVDEVKFKAKKETEQELEFIGKPLE